VLLHFLYPDQYYLKAQEIPLVAKEDPKREAALAIDTNESTVTNGHCRDPVTIIHRGLQYVLWTSITSHSQKNP
jgi:hypothetical protein